MASVGLAGVVGLYILAGASAAAGQLSPGDVKCRQGLAVSARTFASTVLQVQRACHRGRMRGRLPATTDCNDPTQAPGFGRIQRAAADLSTAVPRACAAASTPSANGYRACPAPCAHISVTDYAEVGTCLACVAQDAVVGALSDTYGSLPAPPVLGSLETSCQVKVGRALQHELMAWLRAQQHCQAAADQVSDWPVDCRNFHAPNVDRSTAMSARLIARCDPVALNHLSSCSMAVVGEQTCVFETATAVAARLFDTVFTEPGVTPTYTIAAALTPTPTPAQSPTLTPTSCAGAAPDVDPVVSPTDQLQAMVRACGRNAGSSHVEVSGPAGFGVCQGPFCGLSSCQTYSVPLLPNQVNHLTACQLNGSCPVTVCTSTDYNGAPLDIVQVSASPTPTPAQSPTSTPTRTPTSCAGAAPIVDPVVSPTDQLQAMVRACGRNAGSSYVEVSGPAGFGVCQGPFCGLSSCQTYSVPLLPNQINHLKACQQNGSCAVTVCTSKDYNGAPLDIVQVSASPTPTP